MIKVAEEDVITNKKENIKIENLKIEHQKINNAT